jgi:hypothetical protein
MALGANVVKIFTAVIYKYYKLVCFPQQDFTVCLCFASTARSFPNREETEKCATRVGSWPYPQTLDHAGKAC